MDITQIKIFPVEEEKLKAFVSIVFDHCFMVNDIKVIEGKDGLFLSMPSRRKRSGEFKDVAHPLNNETRRRIEIEVLEEYRQIVDDTTPRRPDKTPDAAEEAKTPPAAGDAAADDEVEAKADETATDAESPSDPSDAKAEAEVEADEPGPESAAADDDGADRADDEGDEEETGDEDDEDALGEVQERHLRDSFWQVS